jgi:hypothetical protein
MMQLCGRIVGIVAGTVLVAGLVGCSSVEFMRPGAFKANGLPKDEYLVGGGMHVEYMAPADGRLYWVEETTAKILAMKSVKADELAEFGSEKMDSDAVKENVGVGLRDAQFRLYFIPDRP